MKAVYVPTTDVNSETGFIRAWHVADRSEVTVDELVAEVETSKAIIDVPSSDHGFILHSAPKDAEIPLSEPIARVFPDLLTLDAFVADAETQRDEDTETRATEPARLRAEQLGIDLATLPTDSLITVQVVEAAAAASTSPTALPSPLSPRTTLPRVALVGAGLGATQVIDILRESGSGVPVAITDDDPAHWGDHVMEVPVIGGFDNLARFFAEDAFDGAVISISTSVPARARLRQACQAQRIPLVNAIDPTARIAADVTIGTGNVVCAHCHFGVGTTVGENNFLSAYNSFDHHNHLGSDISTGPACATSGIVSIGDRVRMGTGIYVEPQVEIGDDVQVASGSIIVTSIPPNHAVKRHVVTTEVVPRR